MKKTTLLTFLPILIAVFTSCTKEYTCTCTTSTHYHSDHERILEQLPYADSKSSTATKELKKKESEEWCNKRENEEVTGETFGSLSYTKTVSKKCHL